MITWLSVEEALERILGYFEVLESEECPLLDCLGRVLAEDVTSGIDIPPLANAGMDGYALRAADVRGASDAAPARVTVVGEVAAGYLFEGEVAAGRAVRIMTGAPIPAGADAVVPFEYTEEERRPTASGRRPPYELEVYSEVKPGANIRAAGEDVRRSQKVLSEGTVLRAGEIGALASLGRPKAKVVRRPVVAILSTGDELLEPGEPPSVTKIYNSNSYSVASLVLKYGGIPRLLGIARDTLQDLHRKIEEGLDADLLVTSAGVSRGDYDVVKTVLAERGEINFWTVRMKPGKPLAFGTMRRAAGKGSLPHLGLPGNPVSSMVSFELFARPAILKMQGRTDLQKPLLEAVLEEEIVNRGGRRYYPRVLVQEREGRLFARLTGPQGSGILTSMICGNALAVIPEDVELVRAGETVRVQMLD